MSLIISPNQNFNLSQAEGGKFVKLDPSNFPSISAEFPFQQYAILTYDLNPGETNVSLNTDAINLNIDEVEELNRQQISLLSSIDSEAKQIKPTNLGYRGQQDAFGKLRVSEPYTIFDSKLIGGDAPLFYDEETSGGTETSNHDLSDSSIIMQVNQNGEYVIRQTKMRFNYQPGKSQDILMTGVLGSIVNNTEARIGYFNSSITPPYNTNYDGVWFERDSIGYSVCISKNGTVNKIYQNNWNIDSLDGNGESGITIDFSKSQIFSIDFEWLGVGIVRFGFIINGIYRYCHIEDHSNNISGTYMRSPNHSVRYEIRSTGGTSTLKQICSSIQSEGGVEPSGITRSIDTGISAVDITNDTNEAIIGIRLKSDSLCTTVELESFSLMPIASGDFRYSIVLNPIYTGTTTWVSIDNSSLEYCIGGNIVISDENIIIKSGYVSQRLDSISAPSNSIIKLGSKIDGTRDEIFLCATPLGNEDFLGTLSVRELNCG